MTWMADNRTEQATPKKRQTAREKGQLLRSRDLISALTLLAVIFVLAWSPEMWIGRWRSYFANVMQIGAWKDSTDISIIQWTSLVVARWLTPILGIAFAAAVSATLAQGGVVISTEALAPNWSRLNPARNIQQLFSLAGFSRILRSLLPAGVMFYLAVRIIVNDAGGVVHSARLPSRAALALLGQMVFRLAWQSGLVLLVWAGVDYLLQRFSYEKSLRMTKQEVRQENKDNEGNPQVKGRMRRLRRELLRRSLNKDVQRATAVISNPTHFAVALEYRPSTMIAPVVVAKGRNLIALKIKELARWHEVPIVENPPLAQALYKAADVGQVIPPKLYAAVAEILAFLYRTQLRLQGKTWNAASTAGAR
jgi:flagellar biosynthesis protein FlhB